MSHPPRATIYHLQMALGLVRQAHLELRQIKKADVTTVTVDVYELLSECERKLEELVSLHG
jgi:hypothetical protein